MILVIDVFTRSNPSDWVARNREVIRAAVTAWAGRNAISAVKVHVFAEKAREKCDGNVHQLAK